MQSVQLQGGCLQEICSSKACVALQVNTHPPRWMSPRIMLPKGTCGSPSETHPPSGTCGQNAV